MSKGHGAGAKARRRMMKLRREGGVMSDKIQVPDGMSQAVHKAFIDASTQDEFVGVDSDALQMILEAALRWLSENPRVPTDAQIEDMKIKLVPVHPHWSNIVAEWQRRMFIAPDLEVDRVDFYIKTPDGEYRPWKPNEAQDEMRKYFDTAFGRFEIDDRVPPGEIRLHNWNGPTLLKVDAREPEVPEEIKGMQGIHLGSVKDQADLDRLVTELNVEAYRRGKESGK